MAKKQSFDEDLIQQRDSVQEVKMGPGNDFSDNNDIPVSETVPVHDLTLTSLAKRKDGLNSDVAGKLEELELLRARQESVARKKNELERLRNNQEKHEMGKRELIDRLEQSLVSFEREEIILIRRMEFLQETKKSFTIMNKELRVMNEEEWPMDNEGYSDELTKALTLLENMRKEYHKALSRLDTLRESKPQKIKDQPIMDDEFTGSAARKRLFSEWLGIGFAFTLPLVLALIALLAFLVFRYPLF